MSPARSVENIKLTRPLPYELCKKVLSVFSPILAHTYIKNILNTFKCSWSYVPPIEMGIVSEVSSRRQLGLCKTSS